MLKLSIVVLTTVKKPLLNVYFLVLLIGYISPFVFYVLFSYYFAFFNIDATTEIEKN